jgi:glycosyltransferase involved in cell wall biosynthesis
MPDFLLLCFFDFEILFMLLLSKPFFSVIICTYNRCKLLRRALQSLLNQTDDDWEAIIVDDGSSDDTYSELRGIIQANPKIRYAYHANRGQSQSKNTGAALSDGKYLTFLDSDDEYKPEHLQIRKEFLEANRGIQFLHSPAKIIGDSFVPDINNPGNLINLDECVIGGTFVVSSPLFRLINGFDEIKFGEDYYFFQKIKKLTQKIYYFDKKTYIYYRNTEDSLCSTMIKT